MSFIDARLSRRNQDHDDAEAEFDRRQTLSIFVRRAIDRLHLPVSTAIQIAEQAGYPVEADR